MSNIKRTKKYKEASPFFQKLWTDWAKSNGNWCNFDSFMTDFKEEDYIPFTDRNMLLFPVLKETKYAGCNSLTAEEAKILGELSKLDESTCNEYEQKIEHVLRILSKDIFKEHSLFLMKEHCKLFSPYNDKAKELLKKLEEL